MGTRIANSSRVKLIDRMRSQYFHLRSKRDLEEDFSRELEIDLKMNKIAFLASQWGLIELKQEIELWD